MLQSLEGGNISDDIIIAGESNDQHEKHVRACLKRLWEKGLTLKKKNYSFSKSCVEFFRNIFSEKGIAPDPKKFVRSKKL